jgi:formylglycine-generating enzyme required for sulfatase activity
MARKKAYIVDDRPTNEDALDFKPYADTLADICGTANTPITIGVFGSWGSGKTSLMQMVRDGLVDGFILSWFDAWKYDKEETLWRAFLLSVLNDLKKDAEKDGRPTEDIERVEVLLYQSLDIEKAGGVTIDLSQLAGSVTQGLLQIGLSFVPSVSTLVNIAKTLQEKGTENASQEISKAITRERSKVHIEQVRSLEQFQEKFSILIEQHVSSHDKRLVVFVDDLDRCLPEKAIQVLEAIKLFFDLKDCVFLLGLDESVIARGVEIRYKDFEKQAAGSQASNPIDGAQYLEKIIQLPFSIPQIESKDMEAFVKSLVSEWPQGECAIVFSRGLGGNPRKVKRTVNTFLMLWKLVGRRKLTEAVTPIRLAKLVTIREMALEFYKLVEKDHTILRDVETYYLSEAVGGGQEVEQEGLAPARGKAERQAVSGPQLPQNLLTLIGKTPALKDVLSLFADLPKAVFKELSLDELNQYFTLAQRAEAPEPVSQAQEPARQAGFEPQLVRVPAGTFLMGSTPQQAQQAIKDGADKNWVAWEQPQHEMTLSEYSIGKYLVTNLQYQVFIRESGHKPPQGWDGDQYPQGRDAHPVVNVSWEDAAAYCEWLSKKTSKPYRLPTEAEWEKAARGTDGRIWPWGNNFGEKMANTAEMKINSTSPVGQFSPQGDSPYGCADMIGNVWEWCADWFDENEYKKRQGKTVADPHGPEKGTYRVLRGGSFINSRGSSRCANRSRNYPNDVDRNYGFRVAVPPIFKSEL